MYLQYRIIAAELRNLGIDSNCAPLVDVPTKQTHEFLLNRCYGFDADHVAHIGRAAAQGMLDGGVLPVVKHIPGHGRAQADSHKELPVVDASHAALSDCDFRSFRLLNDLPLGMTAHVVYSAIDDRPATTSTRMMQIIRDEIGFDGLIMTDDITMQALSGTLSEKTTASLAAGCDVILLCNATLSERAEVAEAAGVMTETAQKRAERALGARKNPDEVDISALEAKLSALTDGQTHG